MLTNFSNEFSENIDICGWKSELLHVNWYFEKFFRTNTSVRGIWKQKNKKSKKLWLRWSHRDAGVGEYLSDDVR